MKRKRFYLPVAFVEYRVRPVKRIDYRKRRDIAAGATHVESRDIMVTDGTSAENWRATVWHEWLHAVFYELGYPELSADEALVESLAIAIMQVRMRAPTL